jgi:hypothetical protein
MPDLVLAEAERDVHELEQYVAVQHTRANDLRTAGRDDEERKAREGLLLLADALARPIHDAGGGGGPISP